VNLSRIPSTLGFQRSPLEVVLFMSKLHLTALSVALFSCTISAQTFSPNYYALGGRSTNPLQVDLNRDGIPDVIFASDTFGAGALLSNASTGKFAIHKYAFNGPYTPLAAGDFNGDNKADVVFYDYTGGSHLFYVGYGDGTGNFSSVVAIPNLPGLTTGQQGTVLAQTADFNGDRRPDVAFAYVAQTATGWALNVVLYLNNGSGFTNAGTIFTRATSGVSYDPTPAIDLLVGDFNAEGHADLAVKALHANGDNQVQPATDLYVLYGDGLGHFTTKTVFTGRVADYVFSAADMNDDGRTDLVGLSTSDNSAHIFYGASSRTFTEKVLSSSVTHRTILWFAPQLADFDGNGRKDIAFISQQPNTSDPNYGITVLHQTTPNAWVIGQYSDIDTFTTYRGWNPFNGPLTLGDYNRDGRADVAAITTSDANSHPDSAAVMLNHASAPAGNCSPTYGIHLCSSTTSSTNPVHFSFSATTLYPLRKMEVWVDGVKRSETYHVFGQQGFSDVSVTLSSGTHKVDLLAVAVDGKLEVKKSYSLLVQ
jgi:hypothetical protein